MCVCEEGVRAGGDSKTVSKCECLCECVCEGEWEEVAK